MGQVRSQNISCHPKRTCAPHKCSTDIPTYLPDSLVCTHKNNTHASCTVHRIAHLCLCQAVTKRLPLLQQRLQCGAELAVQRLHVVGLSGRVKDAERPAVRQGTGFRVQGFNLTC
jgi:hypothetical protein